MIEVDKYRRAVVQARGWRNRLASTGSGYTRCKTRTGGSTPDTQQEKRNGTKNQLRKSSSRRPEHNAGVLEISEPDRPRRASYRPDQSSRLADQRLCLLSRHALEGPASARRNGTA